MISESFSGLWYINEPFAKRMEGIILPRLIAGKNPIPETFKQTAGLSPFDKDGEFSMQRYYLGEYLKQGGGEVAVIPVTGAMSRFGMCGQGNEFISGLLAEAAKEKAVKAVVMKGTTPGGTVDSTEMLADAVRDFPKPIIGYVAGQVASAGVFFMSQADQIVMENSVSAEIGSIGVLYVHVDQSAALDKAGLKVDILRATESVDKARVNAIEPLTEELLAEIQQDLDDSLKAFKGYVRRGRAGRLQSDEVFTGKMYKRKQALSLGLVDQLGSLGDAIKLARKI